MGIFGWSSEGSSSSFSGAVSSYVEACAEVASASVEACAEVAEAVVEATTGEGVKTGSSAVDDKEDLDTDQLEDPNPKDRMVYGPNGTTNASQYETLPADYYGPVKPMGPEIDLSYKK